MTGQGVRGTIVVDMAEGKEIMLGNIQIKDKDRLSKTLLWGTVLVCTVILVSLCFNEGLDYDEAYSYRTVLDHSLPGIWNSILQAHDTDIPLWYCALKVWTWIFGESLFSCKMFSLAGTVATMALGATVIRKIWGSRTAFLFILSVSLSPALMHISVNIRMYTWTVFLVTACALTAYRIVREPHRKLLWGVLYAATVAALFCHYFTAFNLLFVYLYLLLALFAAHRMQVWKPVVCGAAALIPFFIWLVCADFFHLAQNSGTAGFGLKKVDVEEFFWFAFHTRVENSHFMGAGLFLLALLCLILLKRRFAPGDKGFLLLCLGCFPVSYLVAGIFASAADHFFIPRHVMHGMGLMWLGLAVVFSEVNRKAWAAYLLYTVIMAGSAYGISYHTEYKTIPYLEQTKEFIAEMMEPEDVVIYNTDGRFELVYKSYMPEQRFCYIWDTPDLQELAGKRVWFFRCNDVFFSEETVEEYGITYENMGHYGFQIMGDSTDFDILRLEIRGMENDD